VKDRAENRIAVDPCDKIVANIVNIFNRLGEDGLRYLANRHLKGRVTTASYDN
jgi:hypothetical protein